MTRKELVAAVHAGTDGMRGRPAAISAVDIVIKTIFAALAAGEDVEINSFGKFVQYHTSARRYFDSLTRLKIPSDMTLAINMHKFTE